jgi:hypothetical protein
MKKNIAIVVLTIIVGLYFFEVVGKDKKEPELVNNNVIKFHTHSLYGIDGGLFKINHDTGEAHYFNGGVFIPVPTLSYDDVRQLQRGVPQGQPMSNKDRANHLLEKYD